MAELAPAKVWMNRAVFVLLAFVLVVVQLVPLDMRPVIWAMPDFLLVVTLVWVTRRPDYLPILVIAGIFLMADLLFQRPPGLFAALVIILTEALRKRSRSMRAIPLALEWGTVAFGVVAITVVNRLVLTIVMSPQAPLGLTLTQMIATIFAYPVIVLVAHLFFGVTRPVPGQLDGRGQRI